jgi:hypothetical protein
VSVWSLGLEQNGYAHPVGATAKDALRKAGLKRLFFRDAGMPVQD